MFVKFIKRAVFFLIALELLYVLIFNAALNMDLTQRLINKVKPEKFQITWNNAWTPYPFKVHIEDASVWGASSSQKWKVNVGEATAYLSLLPLLKHKVKVYDIDAQNVDYFQRPVKLDDEKIKLASYFAPLQSSETVSKKAKSTEHKKTKVKKEKKPWKITLENISAKGEHSFWINQAKGDFSGDVQVDKLRIETNSGPFSVENGKLNITMDALHIAEKKDVLTQSKIKGSVAIAPIVFSKNKGLKILSFLSLDTKIKSQMGSLDILNIYMHRLDDSSISGKGILNGHIVLDKGILLPNTDLKIDADTLLLNVKEYSVKGEGEILLKIVSEAPKTVQASINFDTLNAYMQENEKQSELFSGNKLTVKAKGSSQLYPIPEKVDILTSVSMEIPSVNVKNISVFQHFVPNKWAFELEKGSGELHLKAALDKKQAYIDMQLLAKEAKLRFSKDSFQSDLDLVVKLDAKLQKHQTGQILKTDMSGSYIALNNTVLAKEKKTSKKWDTHLNIDESTFSLNLPKEIKNINAESFNIKKILSSSDASLKVSGLISQFDWLNLLLKNSLNLHLEGRGEIKADLKLDNGLFRKGSTIAIVPKDLHLGLLDYLFTGDGHFLFSVVEGGDKPSLHFNIALNDAKMKRYNEKQAMIEHVHAQLEGEVKELDLKKEQKDIELHLKIPSAKIKNIAIYNSYIPKNSPFKLTKGSAAMHADIVLSSNNAKGYVKLKTDALTMQTDDQKIAARLTMDMKINSGVPKNMAFDIAGSNIVIDQAKVLGATTSYKQQDWYAKVNLKKANVVWRKPVKLQSETTLSIKDSRPIVAMMDNQKEKHNWLSKLITIQDIKGTAKVNMANNIISFPYAFVKSDKIDIGAKGVISEALREGMFYLRYKKLKLLLKTRNGKKNIDIFHVKKTFDNYMIP
ncbi:hypothetical protein MNB_SV-5-1825 [hydrothermal vent metagenome]|uniref:DUF3971 domain-containing protein n=1 Tax=hydrothermal vent metagenome TaxID=652676 RepID=A0A1W1EE54_9ZZZZ